MSRSASPKGPASARGPCRPSPLPEVGGAQAPSLPAGFGPTFPARAEPAPAVDPLLAKVHLRPRSRLASRGFNKDSRLRHMCDAQMVLHKAGAQVTKQEAEPSDLQRAREAPTEDPVGAAVVAPGVDERARAPRSAESLAADRQRLAQEEKQELNDAVSALRAAGPGGWDAQCFASCRARFIAEGKPRALRGLTALAAKSSLSALDAGAYRASGVDGTSRVGLPTKSVFRWMGHESWADVVEVGDGKATPLVVTDISACEAGLQLRRKFPQAPLFMSFEAAEYTPGGQLLAGADSARNPFQQEMFLRTTLELHTRAAAQCCVEPSSLKERLTRKKSPLVLAAHDVVIFRDNAGKGYPFLPKEEQASCTVLVTGRSVVRPVMAPHGEFFDTTEDSMGYADRLHAIGLAAGALGAKSGLGSGGEVAKGRPLLIIAAQGLTDSSDPQPRESIGKLMQSWRRAYADMFEAVVVACGDRETASKLDAIINTDLYSSALDGRLTKGSFGWNVEACSLSINPALKEMARRLSSRYGALTSGQGLRSAGADVISLGDRDPDDPGRQSVPQSARRRSSVIGAHMDFMESNMQALAPPTPASSSVWVRHRRGTKIKAYEQQKAEERRDVPDGTDSRSLLAHQKEHRLSSAFVHNNAREAFREFEESQQWRNPGDRLSKAIAQAMMTEPMDCAEVSHRQSNATALQMPKEALAHMAWDQIGTRGGANPQSPQQGSASEALVELQALAGCIGEQLKTRQSQHFSSQRPGDPRVAGGTAATFK